MQFHYLNANKHIVNKLTFSCYDFEYFIFYDKLPTGTRKYQSLFFIKTNSMDVHFFSLIGVRA